MSAPTRITRVTDKALVNIFNDLAGPLEVERFLVVYGGNAQAQYNDIIDKADFEDRSYSISRIEALFQGGMWLIAARGQYKSTHDPVELGRFRTHRRSASFDEYWVGGNQQLTVSKAKSIEKAFSKVRAVPEGLGNESGDVVALLTSQLEQLRDLQLDFHQRQLNADAEIRNRQAQLDAEIEARLEAERSELASQKAELETRRKELNDREPQHERRRLREALTGEIKQVLTDPPKKSFLSKNYTYGLFMFAGVTLISISLMLTGDLGSFFRLGLDGNSVPTEAFWIQSLKSLAAGAGGGTFLWAGLSGMKKSEELRIRDASHLQRYSYDMDRASWIVETLLQLTDTESAQVPDVWLEAVCNDLFLDELSARSGQPDSLEALGALLDATTRARIGTDGFDFELDRRRAKELARQVK